LRFEKLGGLEEVEEEDEGVTPGGAGGRVGAWGMWRGRMGRAIMGPMGIGWPIGIPIGIGPGMKGPPGTIMPGIICGRWLYAIS